jgi:YVTN family beta-propeller protein
MSKHLWCLMLLTFALLCAPAAVGQAPRFRVLVFYSTGVEYDHVQFAQDALKFLAEIAAKDDFQVDATTNWENLNESYLKKYQLVVWLNGSPTKPEQRVAFEKYMEQGGAWMGFHGAGYNDKDTHWPWYVDFLGGAVFYINSWPPLPAKLTIDERLHPVTAGLPESYEAPLNEWYVWKPSPRLNKDVRVLLTLDPSNYPLGLKDVLETGDCPVVWTNTKYKMLYMNMGHGGKILSSPTQNELIENAVLWLGGGAVPAKEQQAVGTRVSPQAVAVNMKTKKVYGVNTAEGMVTVVSAATHEAKKIKVGVGPSTISVNPLTNRVYVGNSGEDTVSVIDGDRDQVIATVKVGELPYVVAVNSASDKVYVSKTFSDTTTLINGATNQASVLNTGIQATAIAVNPEPNKSYLIDQGNEVIVLDGVSDATSKIRAGDHAWGITVNPANNKIYLGSTSGSVLTVIDGKSGSTDAVKVGEMPCAIVIDTATDRVYVANYRANSVTIIDGANNAVLATVPVGKHPQALAADSSTHMIYVANMASHSVSVINGQSNAVTATVNLSSGPYAIAAIGGVAYVKCLGEDGLIAIYSNSSTAKTIAATAKP